jgi:hypothetical protein
VVNFPASLDALLNPTSTTKRNAPGFELDVVISTLNDIAEALEAKLGTGASTPSANTVLRGTGTGTTTYGQVQAGEIAAGAVTQRMLSGIFSGTRTAATYADVDTTNGKATLTTTGGDLVAFFAGYGSNSNASIVQHVALRLDSGAEVGALPVYSFPGAATYPMPFCCVYVFQAVSAAAHSVFARHINDSAAGTMTTTGQIFLLELKK